MAHASSTDRKTPANATKIGSAASRGSRADLCLWTTVLYDRPPFDTSQGSNSQSLGMYVSTTEYGGQQLWNDNHEEVNYLTHQSTSNNHKHKNT